MSKILNLNVNTDSKNFMFDLGRMFALGVQIKILNIDEVEEKIKKELEQGYSKSFNMMVKYWQDNGLNLKMYQYLSDPQKAFLICPVRNATDEEKANLSGFISSLENEGLSVHYPTRDTNQNPVVDGVNTGGFNICLENAKAIANAGIVAVYLNKESTGSMFDLGVAYEMRKCQKDKRIILLNDVKLDDKQYVDIKALEMFEK